MLKFTRLLLANLLILLASQIASGQETGLEKWSATLRPHLRQVDTTPSDTVFSDTQTVAERKVGIFAEPPYLFVIVDTTGLGVTDNDTLWIQYRYRWFQGCPLSAWAAFDTVPPTSQTGAVVVYKQIWATTDPHFYSVAFRFYGDTALVVKAKIAGP